MYEIYFSWQVWTPTGANRTGISGNVISLENLREQVKMQISAEMLAEPEKFSFHFEQALDVIENQLDKTKFEFYKWNVEANQVASYLRRYNLSRSKIIIKIPILNQKVTKGGSP